ncbi:sulfate transporter CysZ [Catenovulum sp. SM1970]|uniref:sulfate transporter CysZ n=1 Tax=Marinifaba aquimaris TaxID=2741323 RepID=UPI0015735907|nr:sulfate transporter CysZ [Marinifaba aquimaris]NTS77370.1 sulfate transporter CysZ [Marinifaba aquimaris]
MNYFLSGFSLISQKGLKRFVFIPLIINIIIFTGAFIYLLNQLSSLNEWVLSLLPSWLTWLSYLVGPFVVLLTLLSFYFLFTAVANFIAAPFNGILSERVQALLTGEKPNVEESFNQMLKRSLQREWQKLVYSIPKTIGFFILFWIPFIGPVLWFLFGAWMLAIQYCDYPFDNHQIEFNEMRDELWQNKGQSFSFGTSALICTMIPILNFLVMPVAVCGATKLWVEKYHRR